MYLLAEWIFQLSQPHLSPNRSPAIVRRVRIHTYLPVLSRRVHPLSAKNTSHVISCWSNRACTSYHFFLLPPLPRLMCQRQVVWYIVPHPIHRKKKLLNICSGDWRPVSHNPSIWSSQWIPPFPQSYFRTTQFRKWGNNTFWMELHTKVFTSFENGLQNIK